MESLSTLSIEVLRFIDSFEGDVAESAIKHHFGDEITLVLDTLKGDGLLGRRLTKDDGWRVSDGPIRIAHMRGPSGDYYMEDKGKIHLKNLSAQHDEESRRKAKDRILDIVCGVVAGFIVGFLLARFGFKG